MLPIPITKKEFEMASSVMASVSLKPTPFRVERSSVRGLPALSRPFKVVASGIKKIKTDTPYGNSLPLFFLSSITCMQLHTYILLLIMIILYTF